MKFPRQPEPRDGWILEFSFLKRVKDEVCKVPEHFELDMEQIEEVLLALEKCAPEQQKGLTDKGQLVCPRCTYFFFPSESKC